MEKLNNISLDNRLEKTEISEIIKLMKDVEGNKISLESEELDKKFKDFINSEYRWANENYLKNNGKTVSDLQTALGFKGDNIDGLFGKKTFFALINFQKTNGLIVDGLAGDKTHAKLVELELLSPKKKVSSTFENTKVKNYLYSKYKNKGYNTNYNFGANDYFNISNVDTGFSTMFSSVNPEKGYCSRITRKNLAKIGLNESEIAHGDSAVTSMFQLSSKQNYAKGLSNLPEGTNVLDIYPYSKNSDGHRACAFLSNRQWYVLDPLIIYPSNKDNPTNAIPWDEYMTRRTLKGVFAYTV